MRTGLSFLGIAAALTAASPMLAQQPDRGGPPELGPPPRLRLPAAQEFTLSNGLRVMLLEKHQVPVVQVNLVVEAGAGNEAADRMGLASLVADMMDEGAGERDALALADAIDFLGVRLSVRAGTHTMMVSLFTPASRLSDALPLMADVALRPTFPADELERKRTSRLTQLLQWHDEPSAVADVLFNKALYGTTHPYGFSSLGTEASIRAVTVEDLRVFHRAYVRPNNAFVVVVGDVTPAAIQERLERAFGSWEPGRIPAPRWPQAQQVRGRRILLVDKPGAAQSEIVIGRIGVTRKTDDYYALQVMNTILGGSFTSRLNDNLRERNGYSYGAGSGFSYDLLPGPFQASSAVQTDATDKALREFFNEFRGIREPIADDELQRGKNYVALRYPGQFQSVGSIAGALDDLYVYDLPEDYLSQYVDRILAVSPRDVMRVARQYIDPDNMLIVVVGDRAKVEAGIRALNLGAVEVLSIEDVLGPKPVLD
ncbi:MAG TPA: pitrilysin family protein [Gemmatimonadales bacterium]|jgi:predicted Zn-dependent peptidase